MKFLAIIVAGLLLGLVSYVYELQSTNSVLEEQLEVAMSYQSQLQQLSEDNARQRLSFEAQLQTLQGQLLTTGSQLNNLKAALQDAQEQINPDYTEMLEQARAEVAQQANRRRRSPGNPAFAAFADPTSARSLAANSISKQYASYFSSLDLSIADRELIEEAMVDYGSERYQMLGDLLEGNLGADQAVAMFGANGLINNMQDMLSDEQLAVLSQYELTVKQDAARQIYGNSLQRNGSFISGVTQDRVMDVVLDELFSEQNNYGALVADDGSMTTAFNDQLAAYDRARERLQVDLNADQLGQFDQFMENQTNGIDIILDVTTDANGQTSIMRSRIGGESLPQ